MSQIKIPLIVFIVVFVVSGLLAFFGGSSYLGIAFKAFVSAITAVVFVFVAKFLLEKYVPDMFENPDAIDVSDSPVVGTNIDVKIGGIEVPLGNAGVSSASQGSSIVDDVGSMEGLADDSLSQEDPLKDIELEAPDFKPTNFATTKDNEPANEKGNNASVVQQAHELSAQTEKKTKSDAKIDSDEESVDVSIKQQNSMPSVNASNNTETPGKDAGDPMGSVVSVVDDKKLSEEEMDMAIEKDVDRLEELPDLHEFIDSSTSLKQSKAEELMSQGTQSFFETNLAEDAGTDSKLMANAIRTVLRRE